MKYILYIILLAICILLASLFDDPENVWILGGLFSLTVITLGFLIGLIKKRGG